MQRVIMVAQVLPELVCEVNRRLCDGPRVLTHVYSWYTHYHQALLR